MCEQYEVRFYCRNVLIHSQPIKATLLEKGFLWVLAEEYAAMPLFKGKMLNVQLRPIKKDNMDLDFGNNRIVMEAY